MTEVDAPTAVLRTVEDHAAHKGTLPVWFAAAKALHAWPVGKVISETEFDTAVLAAQSVECRLNVCNTGRNTDD